MAPNPSVGVMLPRDLPAAQVLPFARSAEDLGFDELWVVEDLGFRGGFTQAAAVLGATARIRVGIGILPAAVRNPVYAAMEIATLEQLFPGRTDVGIGQPVWTSGSDGIVFTEVNDNWRSYRARYHRLGRPTVEDVTLYEETEELGFSVGAYKSKDKSLILIATGDNARQRFRTR